MVVATTPEFHLRRKRALSIEDYPDKGPSEYEDDSCGHSEGCDLPAWYSRGQLHRYLRIVGSWLGVGQPSQQWIGYMIMKLIPRAFLPGRSWSKGGTVKEDSKEQQALLRELFKMGWERYWGSKFYACPCFSSQHFGQLQLVNQLAIEYSFRLNNEIPVTK